MNELVSIIIPTYNRGNIIRDSIESVLNQTYGNIEIIVVDDCGTDNTKEVVESINDGRIKYIRLEKNKGAGGARNEGVKFAEGQLIAFHDSDDICMEDRIERQMEYLSEHPEFDLVYSSYIKVQDNIEYVIPVNCDKVELEGDIYRKLLVRNTVGCPTILLKKDGFNDIGGFDETYSCLEDWDFIIRYSKKHLIGFIDTPLILSKYSQDGLSADSINHFKTRSRMIASYKEELERMDLFKHVVMTYFASAEKTGWLDFAKSCLMQELVNTANIN